MFVIGYGLTSTTLEAVFPAWSFIQIVYVPSALLGTPKEYTLSVFSGFSVCTSCSVKLGSIASHMLALLTSGCVAEPNIHLHQIYYH